MAFSIQVDVLMDELIQFFKNEISNYTEKPFEDEWNAFKPSLKSVSCKKGSVIFHPTKVCTEMLFVVEGIVVTEYFNGSSVAGISMT